MKNRLRRVYLVLYYAFAKHLPSSSTMYIGRGCRAIRYFLCKRIFEECGRNVNIERGASFGSGAYLKIGDNSGIGINCSVPNNIQIGCDVMMGPNCVVFYQNHESSRVDIPMTQQGTTEPLKTIIDDDVWIGQNVLIMPGRHISRGTIVAAGTVLSKDFPEFSVIGGNPSRLLKSRI